MLEKLKMKEVEEENEDMSFWEELEILNEEDFLSPEEKESIAAAEKELMEKFKNKKRTARRSGRKEGTTWRMIMRQTCS